MSLLYGLNLSPDNLGDVERTCNHLKGEKVTCEHLEQIGSLWCSACFLSEFLSSNKDFAKTKLNKQNKKEADSNLKILAVTRLLTEGKSMLQYPSNFWSPLNLSEGHKGSRGSPRSRCMMLSVGVTRSEEWFFKQIGGVSAQPEAPDQLWCYQRHVRLYRSQQCQWHHCNNNREILVRCTNSWPQRPW